MANKLEPDNLEGFQNWLRTNDKSGNTIKRYCQAVRTMLRWIKKPAGDITQEDIDRYKLYLKDSYDDNSLVPFGAAVNNYMKYLGKEVKMKIPGIRRKNVVPLTEREIEKMLATAKVIDLLDYAMIATAYYGALRRNELRNLKIGDVDFDRGKLRINKGKGDRYNEVNLHPIAIAAIRAYLLHRAEPKERSHRDHLFISPHSREPIKRTYLNDRLKEIAQKAGIVKRCYGHLLRHSLITHMSDNGATIVEIQRQSRHKDIETLSGYIHPDEAKARDTYLRTVAYPSQGSQGKGKIAILGLGEGKRTLEKESYSDSTRVKDSYPTSMLPLHACKDAENQFNGISNEQRRQLALDALLTGHISEETYKDLIARLDAQETQRKTTYIQ